MKKVAIDKYEFLIERNSEANIYFSTAKNDLNFNANSPIGKSNILMLKKWFELDDVLYLHQIHSDIVCVGNHDLYNCEGDGIITNMRNVAVGVFTADCVPILMYDRRNKVIAAVHSGWKGTFSCIAVRTMQKMEKQFGSKPCDIVVYIGPHIMDCCYEIGEDVALKFKSCKLYDGSDIIKNNKLSLKTCIIKQFESICVPAENINSLDICTFCSKEYEMYSYRKSKIGNGRMFSFIFMK